MAKVITNHDSLYFNDGNIILLAPQSPNHYTAFRVHRSILTRMSTVFEELFSTPQVDKMETYEGIPYVYMVDGSDALQSLLQLVYHEVYVCPCHGCKPSGLPMVPKSFAAWAT